MTDKIEEMSILEKLCHIQNEMKVPKNLYNKFGNYNYRNAETILETAKPICMKYQCTLKVFDEIMQVGERYYVKATAELTDWNMNSCTKGEAYAREEESKKGMDSSQVTGSCSSYARKYALNGLFNLDDTKDADSNEHVQEAQGKAQKQAKQDVENMKKEYNSLVKQMQQCGFYLDNENVSKFFMDKAKVEQVKFDEKDLKATRRLMIQFKRTIEAKKQSDVEKVEQEFQKTMMSEAREMQRDIDM